MRRNAEREAAAIAVLTRYRDRCAAVRASVAEPAQRPPLYGLALRDALDALYHILSKHWKPGDAPAQGDA